MADELARIDSAIAEVNRAHKEFANSTTKSYRADMKALQDHIARRNAQYKINIALSKRRYNDKLETLTTQRYALEAQIAAQSQINRGTLVSCTSSASSKNPQG